MLVEAKGEGRDGVLVVPELAGHPDVFAPESGFAEAALDAAPDELLVAIGGGAVDVAVAGLDCVSDGLGGIAAVEVPGSET